MRIVFIGTVDFSHSCLEFVIKAGGKVVGVVTSEPKAARINSDYADLAPLAEIHGIPVLRVARINTPETLAAIRAMAPDVMFVFGFSQLLGPELLAIPPRGVIGSHPTLLPEGRGRHPLIWTLVKGLDYGGLSFFFMAEGADNGDILWQRSFPVGPDDDAATLYEKIIVLAQEAIVEFLPQLEAGTAPRIKQDESRATVWPRRSEKDGEIDWSAPSATIHKLVRALTRPYVGAHSFAGGERLTIWCSQIVERPQTGHACPGTVLEAGPGRFVVRTGDGALAVLAWDGTGSGRLERGTVLGSTTTDTRTRTI